MDVQSRKIRFGSVLNLLRQQLGIDVTRKCISSQGKFVFHEAHKPFVHCPRRKLHRADLFIEREILHVQFVASGLKKSSYQESDIAGVSDYHLGHHCSSNVVVGGAAILYKCINFSYIYICNQLARQIVKFPSKLLNGWNYFCFLS